MPAAGWGRLRAQLLLLLCVVLPPLQAYLDVCDTFTATVAALLWAVYQRAAVGGVQLTTKNCPTVVADNISK